MAVPFVSRHWETLFMVVAGITILYGNLCALPQRSLKRLLGYSSIAHAGYLMLGVAALNSDGSAASFITWPATCSRSAPPSWSSAWSAANPTTSARWRD